MLTLLAIILFAAWLLGLVCGNFLGGLLHVLLMAAILILVVQVVQDRRSP